jgi:Zn ribbon nucleic-acid-binding protein
MSLIIFQCRSCESEITTGPEPASKVDCPACGKPQHVYIMPSLSVSKQVETCVACGYDDFYIQKDFNRRLGMGIVVVGILFSTYFFNHRQPINAMASLVITAIVDLIIYSLVGTVTVCYSCHAVYRGFEKNPDHPPFDLKKLEKYGGRTPRFGA